jgi:hypothetical protein
MPTNVFNKQLSYCFLHVCKSATAVIDNIIADNKASKIFSYYVTNVVYK